MSQQRMKGREEGSVEKGREEAEDRNSEEDGEGVRTGADDIHDYEHQRLNQRSSS